MRPVVEPTGYTLKGENKESKDPRDLGLADDKDAPIYIRDMKALIELQPLSTNEIGERCFSLLGGRVVFGILFAELPDSFLVGLPSTLVSDGREIDGKLMTASPVIRLLKSGVAFVSIPESEHQYYYFRHIYKLVNVLPGFFTPERMAQLDEVMSSRGERDDRGKASRIISSEDSEQETMMFSPYENTTRH